MHSVVWIVTGASGFVGKHVVQSLANSPVIGLVRTPGRGGRVLKAWTPQGLAAALKGATGVVHAASVVHRPGASLEEYQRFNIDGTRMLIEASRAAGVRRLIFISSIKVHGEDPPGPINEQTPIAAQLAYAQTKADAEQLVRGAVDLNPVVLRLCPVYGVGEKGNVRTMIRAIARRRFLIPGRGDVRKSIVHVSTVADVVRAASTSAATGAFVVADPHTPSIRELADTIASLLGRRRPMSIPHTMLERVAAVVGRTARRLGMQTNISAELVRKAQTSTVCDPSRAIRELGITCHVDLRETLREEIEWLRHDRLL